MSLCRLHLYIHIDLVIVRSVMCRFLFVLHNYYITTVSVFLLLIREVIVVAMREEGGGGGGVLRRGDIQYIIVVQKRYFSHAAEAFVSICKHL